MYWSGREKPVPSCRVTIKIPGRGGAGGCAAMASEAAENVSERLTKFNTSIHTDTVVI